MSPVRFFVSIFIILLIVSNCSYYPIPKHDKPAPEEGLCSEDGWCWQNPLPHGNSIMLGIWGSGPRDIWAVGGLASNCPECGGGPDAFGGRRTAGAILHWDGSTWSHAKFHTNEALTSVWGTSRDDVWAVGTRGVILHWDGRHWEEVARDETSWLHRIVGVAPDDVWAVGYTTSNGGRLAITYHWDGAAWSRVTGPEREGSSWLVDAWATSEDDVWVVADRAWRAGCMIHWDGQAWSEWELDIPEDVEVVGLRSEYWGSSPDDVWAAGEGCRYQEMNGNRFCASGGLVAHWNGQVWSLAFLEDRIPDLIWGLGPSDVRMFGGYSPAWELNWDGEAWTEKETEHQMTALWADSGEDLWAIAGDALMHFGGSEWNEVPMPFEGVRNEIADMGGTALDALWAVGERGTVLFLDGSTWLQRDAGVPAEEDCVGVFAPSSGDVWIATSTGRIAHFNGSDWTSDRLDTDLAIIGLRGRTSDDIWCHGRRGATFHFDGSSWSRQDVDEETDILAVWPVSNGDAWAVGSSGRVFRWDGSTWHSQDTGIQDPLVDVGVTPSGEVWLLSMYDVYRQASSDWVRLDSLPESIYWLSAIYVSAGDDVWITDSGGNIFHWDGESWRQLESGTALWLNGMYALGEHLWAYGAMGTILHRTRSKPGGSAFPHKGHTEITWQFIPLKRVIEAKVKKDVNG